VTGSTDESADMRTEEALVGVDESLEVLELRPTSLRFKGTTVAASWCDNMGSIGQYLLRAGFSRDKLQQKLEKIRFFVEHGVPEHVGLWDAVEDLLPLFAPGTYLLRYPYEGEGGGFDLIEWESSAGETPYRDSFYPYGVIVLATRPSAQLDPERIEHWREKIRRGGRPMAIIAGVEGVSYRFLIDGHHKLKAYQAEDLPPPLFAIDAREIRDPLSFRGARGRARGLLRAGAPAPKAASAGK